MAPARQPPQPFSKDEKVLCFHGEMLYEAKILDIQPAESGEGFQYRIHYKGWKNTWDDWVSIDRIRKFTEENKELASQLHAQMKDLRQKSSAKPPKKGNLRVNGTDSARGSEERTAGVAATGRGPRRARDFDLEQKTSPSCLEKSSLVKLALNTIPFSDPSHFYYIPRYSSQTAGSIFSSPRYTENALLAHSYLTKQLSQLVSNISGYTITNFINYYDYPRYKMSSPSWDHFVRVHNWVLSQQAAHYPEPQPNYYSPPQRGFMSRLDYVGQLAHYHHNNPVGRAEDAIEREYRREVEAVRGEDREVKINYVSDLDYEDYERPAPASEDDSLLSLRNQQRKRCQPEPDDEEEDAAFKQQRKRRRMYSDEDDNGNGDSEEIPPLYSSGEEYDEYDVEEVGMNPNRFDPEEEDDFIPRESRYGDDDFDEIDEEEDDGFSPVERRRVYSDDEVEEDDDGYIEEIAPLPNRRRKYISDDDDFDDYDEASFRQHKKVRRCSPEYEGTEDEFYQADDEDEEDEDQASERASESDGDVDPASVGIMCISSDESDESAGSDGSDDDGTSITSDSSLEFLGEWSVLPSIENQHNLRNFQDGESEGAEDVVEEVSQRPCGTKKRKHESSVEVLFEFSRHVRHRQQ
ncbi:histone acetylase complex subunit [Colletotrichum salicis]|uniref:Chromatin modification-related protein EAF3 n=1 Tax=Colletotrichum salicis TaxID=1209931 RepID=A0A135U5F4_9PEZI|nr:histone acetylase complex subunit [Colletotrichum salicis]